MDRSWMYGNRATLEYVNGVNKFSRCALDHRRRTGDKKIFCPCRNCNNTKKYKDIELIEDHLFRRGFKQEYHVWIWHGEKDNRQQPTVSPKYGITAMENSGNENLKERTNDGETDEDMHEVDGAIVSREAKTTSSNKNRKGRGQSKGLVGDVPRFLEYDEFGQPTGKWSADYGKHLGSCVHKININVPSYMEYDEGEKLKLWEETKNLFHIHDTPKKEREALFHSGVAKRFRDHKAKLVRRWITMKAPPLKNEQGKKPWQLYDNSITKEDWEKFEETWHSDEFQEKSKRGRQNALKNDHPHHLGQKSYNRARLDWEKQGRIPLTSVASSSAASSSTVTSSTSERVRKRIPEWVCAREVKQADGTYSVPSKYQKTKEAVERIKEYMEKESQGTFTPERGNDALTLGIGKKDHRGCVRGLGGVNVGYAKAFGPPDRRRSSQCGSCSEVAELRASLKLLEDTLQDRVAMEVKKHVVAMMGNSEISTTHSDIPCTNQIHSPPRSRVLEGPTRCRLAIDDVCSGNMVVVADGTVYPSARMLHCKELEADHWKVTVDKPYDEYREVPLPKTTDEGATKLGQAHGSFVQWPMAFVLFEDKELETCSPQKMAKSGDKDPSCSPKSRDTMDCTQRELPLTQPSPQVEECFLGPIGNDFKFVLDLLSNASDGEYHITPIPIKAPNFYYEKDTQSYVNANDIHEFRTWACAKMSLLHVFMLYLIEEHIFESKLPCISFLCPRSFSESRIQTHCAAVTSYLTHAFDTERNKEDAQCKYILAPFNFNNHWILYVIDLCGGVTYVFDSSKSSNKKGRNKATRNVHARILLDMAFKVYRMKGGKSPRRAPKKLKFQEIECAQQPGATESGYYVMKYMHEIVTQYKDCQDLLKEYVQRIEPYNSEELSLIREEWAKFFAGLLLDAIDDDDDDDGDDGDGDGDDDDDDDE